MKIGAHVSAAGGVDKALERAEAMGAETAQIFSGAPQAWRRKEYRPAEVEAYMARLKDSSVAPLFVHGVYLVNLATHNTEHLAKSIDALVHDMKVCHLLRAVGVIFHLGSHRGAGYSEVLAQVIDSSRRIVNATPDDTFLILENSAGMGDAIGSKIQELSTIIREVGSPRVKVCLDTQHAFASGYDVKSPGGLETLLEEFDNEIGLKNLVAVHANDSKCPLGGGIDRHENIGHGYIGLDGFENILSHPALANTPFLLEVPGAENKGPDRENVEALKRIRDKLQLAI